MIMFIKNFCFLFLCFIVSNSFSQNIDTSNLRYKAYYYPNGNMSSEGYLEEGKPNKYWITYYENGLRKSEGNRKNYQLDSIWSFYRENGNIKQKITYKDGIKNGASYYYQEECLLIKKELFINGILEDNTIEYFPDSSDRKVKSITPYKNGQKNGVAVEYAIDGRIIKVAYYEKGFIQSEERINRFNEINQKVGLWKDFYPSFKVKKEQRFKEDLLNGYVKYYSVDGKLDSAILYFMGERQSDEKNLALFDIDYTYHPNGKIKQSTSYNLSGKKEGVSNLYDSLGNVLATSFYKNGILVKEGLIDKTGKEQGIWIDYYPDGSIRAKGEFKDGNKLGKWVYYFQDGSIEQEGFYNKNGQFTGEWRWYYQNGKLQRREEFRRGKEDGELEEYDENGKLITKGDYIDGLKEGDWYYALNDHREEGKYRYGERNGKWVFYYYDDKIAFEGSFVDGIPEGKHLYYYPNGVLEKEEKYLYGLKDGKWKWFDRFGSETLTIVYDEGKEKKIDGQRIKLNDK